MPPQFRRRIGYDNRVSSPEGIPPAFAPLIIAFPDRLYGMWWHIRRDGTPSMPQGWYIWIESEKLLGVSYRSRLLWLSDVDFERGLTAVANLLRYIDDRD